MRNLIASVIIEVNMLSEEKYKHFLEKHFKNYNFNMLRKIIYQNHQNSTDEVMIIGLNDYYRQESQRDIDEFELRLMVVLYELKRDNLDKFNEFVQKYASLNQ